MRKSFDSSPNAKSSYTSSLFPSISSRPSFSSQGPTSYQGHHVRDDNMSEAPFPLRAGSQDVYRARDITQRAPSVAPSTMVPNNIPYPGVYNSTSSLSTTSPLPPHASATNLLMNQNSRSGGTAASIASAALNAAGLPSRVGFFGLGRKASKRSVASSTNPRSRQGTNDSMTGIGQSNLSISAPLQPPPPPASSSMQHLPPVASRSANMIRPSGPRPSFSSSGSERDHLVSSPPLSNTYSSASSLPSIPQQQQQPSYSTLSSRPSMSSIAHSASSHSTVNNDLVNTMQDILPQASKDVLARYLAASGYVSASLLSQEKVSSRLLMIRYLIV